MDSRSLLAMDAQTIRRAVYDLFKFNTKDFIVQGSPTGYQVSAVRHSSGAAGGADPCYFEVTDASTPMGLALRVSWGVMNGGVPGSAFTPQGSTYSPEIENGYVFAKVTFDISGTGFVTTREIAFSESPLNNTPTIGYELLATFVLSGAGTRYTVATNCGNVDISPCDLTDP